MEIGGGVVRPGTEGVDAWMVKVRPELGWRWPTRRFGRRNSGELLELGPQKPEPQAPIWDDCPSFSEPSSGLDIKRDGRIAGNTGTSLTATRLLRAPLELRLLTFH